MVEGSRGQETCRFEADIFTVFADFQRQKSGHQKKFDQGLGTKRRFSFLQMNLKKFSHEDMASLGNSFFFVCLRAFQPMVGGSSGQERCRFEA